MILARNKETNQLELKADYVFEPEKHEFIKRVKPPKCVAISKFSDRVIEDILKRQEKHLMEFQNKVKQKKEAIKFLKKCLIAQQKRN